jgi:hypothetical protein
MPVPLQPMRKHALSNEAISNNRDDMSAQPLTMDKLIGMTRPQLDELFMSCQPGPLPEGNSQGEAIVHPGSFWTRIFRWLIYKFDWQGKVFKSYKCPQCGTLVLTTLENKIGLDGVHAIEAVVYYGDSWLDKKKCIVLDYSKTSLLAKKIRDEIRLVGPNLYLGNVWWGKTRLIDFALKFKS